MLKYNQHLIMVRRKIFLNYIVIVFEEQRMCFFFFGEKVSLIQFGIYIVTVAAAKNIFEIDNMFSLKS